MKLLVCIDDTDNLECNWGTGELANKLIEAIHSFGWGTSEPITRHQLFIHPDIPYTSHNSSMCFACDLKAEHIEDLIVYAGDFLEKESAEGSDPGLCVVIPERLTQPGWLISFGYAAKEQILTKDDAYMLADELGVHLSEHGGTGLGVIGALAGTGLRLSGNDGRVRGKIKTNYKDNIASVRELLDHTYIEMVKSIEDGYVLGDKEKVLLGDTVKGVLLNNKLVLLVNPITTSESEGLKWQTCSKQQLKAY